MNREGRIPNPNERFANSYVRIPDCGCWLWTGRTAVSNGSAEYGRFFANGKLRAAHRASYEIFVGAIPTGLQIDHLCRTPLCVNPCHLEIVTGAENIRRGNGRCGINFRKTACIRGHELSGKNLGLDRNGNRFCRSCRDTSKARFEQRKKLKGKNHA